MSKIVQDVKRFLWLHPQINDPTVDPVELLRALLAEHQKLADDLKKQEAAA